MSDLKFDGESFATTDVTFAVFDIGCPIIGLPSMIYNKFSQLFTSQPNVSNIV